MPPTPHDVLVKKTFSIAENAAGELRAVLPSALAARISWATLRVEKGSYADDEGREWHTDLLFSAQLDGREALIYVLFEHQSTVDRWMPLRVLVYMTRIWTELREQGRAQLPVIVPVIVHHSETGWTAGRHLSDLLDADDELLALARPYVPELELLVDDLTRISELELIRRSMMALAKLVVWALRAVRVGFDPELIDMWAHELEKARVTAGTEALRLFLRYLSEVEGGPEIYGALVDADVSAEVREVAMSLRKEWEEAGRQRGLDQGRAEGRAELLSKQLRLKFGELPEWATDRVQQASVEELDRWAERVLTGATLEQVLA